MPFDNPPQPEQQTTAYDRAVVATTWVVAGIMAALAFFVLPPFVAHLFGG